MSGIIVMGLVSALGAFLLIWKINLEWFCKYQWQTDLVITSLFTWLYFGTFSGMAAAAVAGVIFSIMLYFGKVLTRSFL